MVKRYTSPAIIFTAADGPLVDYTDYAKLAADKADLLRVLGVADARVKALEAALRDLLDDMGEDVRQRHHRDKYRVYQISPQTVEAARKTLLFPTAPETPPHLRGPVIQAYADTNGVPPTSQETPVDDLNLQPIGHCDKCGRKVWKASTLGQIDEMLQPGGGICGGRFVSDRGAAK